MIVPTGMKSFANDLRTRLEAISKLTEQVAANDVRAMMAALAEHPVHDTPLAVNALYARFEEAERAADATPSLVQIGDDTNQIIEKYEWMIDQGFALRLETHGSRIYLRFKDDADAALFRLRWC